MVFWNNKESVTIFSAEKMKSIGIGALIGSAMAIRTGLEQGTTPTPTPPLADLYRDPIYVPDHKINRVRGDNEEGDYRIATCKLHRGELFDTQLRITPFRRISGTVYVEQEYKDADGW